MMCEVPGQMLAGKIFCEETVDTAFSETDAKCQPCHSNGEQTVAIGYCQNCQEHFCRACLKYHRKQAVSKYHNILEGHEMPEVATSHDPVVFCVHHSNEIVKFYCSHHDDVGCSDCMVLDHKACQIDRIQDIAETYFNGPEHTELKTTADEFLKRLELVINKIQTNKETVQETYSKAITDIKAFIREVNDYIVKAEAKLISKLNRRKLQDDDTLTKLMEEGQASKEFLQQLGDKLNVQNNQAKELFLTAKQTKGKLENIGDAINELLHDSQVRRYEFEHSAEIETIIASKSPLGRLRQVKSIAEMEPEFDREIELKAPEDTNHCRIVACAIITPGLLVVTDAGNSCVKIVDVEKRQVSGGYILESIPHGVTAVSDELIAVTLPDVNKIELLTLRHGKQLSECADIQVDGICEGIVYINNTFILSMQNYVKVISITGEELRNIYPSKRNNLKSIALEQYSGRLYVSDNPSFEIGSTVHIINPSGKVVGSYRALDISQISGLAVSSDGTLFVCNRSSSSGLQVISPEYKKIKEILKHNKHVIRPWCIAFCDKTDTLFLVNYMKNLTPKLRNVLKVFKLK